MYIMLPLDILRYVCFLFPKDHQKMTTQCKSLIFLIFTNVIHTTFKIHLYRLFIPCGPDHISHQEIAIITLYTQGSVSSIGKDLVWTAPVCKSIYPFSPSLKQNGVRNRVNTTQGLDLWRCCMVRLIQAGRFQLIERGNLR